MSLIEKELLEIGYSNKKIYTIENITIEIFDMGLTEIYKSNVKIFEGRINTEEELKLIFSSLDIPSNKNTIYYNNAKANLEKHDLIECFTKYGYCLISLKKFNNFPNQKYIYIKEGHCISQTGQKIEFTDLELKYLEFEYVTSEQVAERRLLLPGVKIQYFTKEITIESIIHNIELGSCLIKSINTETPFFLIPYKLITIV